MRLFVFLGAIILMGCAYDEFWHPRHDPQEDNPKLRTAFEEADAYAKFKTRNDPPRMGEVHEYWRYKKEYLLQKYGIHWRDPQEMNPHVAYD